MKKKITALGTTSKGNKGFKIENSKLFFDQLIAMNGNILIEISPIENDANIYQKTLFQKEIVASFMKLSSEQDQLISQEYAQQYLLQQISGQSKDLDDLSSSEINEVIKCSKRFLLEFFNYSIE